MCHIYNTWCTLAESGGETSCGERRGETPAVTFLPRGESPRGPYDNRPERGDSLPAEYVNKLEDCWLLLDDTDETICEFPGINSGDWGVTYKRNVKKK